jgi:ppGpp synthetase/RelA/SpoT-type nucleotidyltranferase
MAISVREHTKGQVDAAGRLLAGQFSEPPSANEILEAFNTINNWRSVHSFPLNTFQKTLRRKAGHIDAECLVAQRIKRLSSILHKLRRFPQMNLSRMQDIGGCRAVVSSVAHVNRLVNIYEQSDIKHKVARRDDYIDNPKTSGYRGIHIVYSYFSDRRKTYNGLKIEMQFRSQLQHAWATAVETVGTFIQQALKSSQGEEEWLRFFALMGTAIAFRENSPAVPSTPTDRRQLKDELRHLADALNVENRLQTFGVALKTVETGAPKKAHYFLLTLDPAANSVTVKAYRYHELERATSDYLTIERVIADDRPGADAVLVSVDSMDSLRRAYPNYFLDTNAFIKAVKQAIQ